MENSIITTEKLNKNFKIGDREQAVLTDLDLDVREGDFTVIMGASGAGKSTLLYALSGMDTPTGGKIMFNHESITGLSQNKLALFRRDNCGFVFQQMFLLDNMSIMDNIIAAGLLVSNNKKEIVRYAKELLTKVGLTEIIWNKFPNQLSGGENQRAAIVRALINRPKVVFADEPTGALNSAAGKSVLDVLTEINENGQSVIMVTHDLKSARRGNRILYINDGVVMGECDLGKYESGDKERHQKLASFLVEMGW